VNLVGEENLEKMNVSAIDFPPDFSEFAEANLTPVASTKIQTPRIGESPVAFECQLFRIVELGSSRSLVLGQVVAMHVRDEAVIDYEKCYIDARKLRLIGRMEANTYVKTTDIVHLPGISLQKWLSR
jgi:flavin reductase (DIM6/NTAB) family NADH-FMN oxidoreductase RutF